MDSLLRVLEAVAVTLREGVEAALVVAITVAYLRRTGSGSLVGVAYWGVAAAIAASIAAAVSVDLLGLGRLKTIFWRHNIVAFAPSLARTVEVRGRRAVLAGTWFDHEIEIPDAPGRWRTGVRALAPSWRVDGAWVTDAVALRGPQLVGAALVGRALAARLGVGVGERLGVRAGARAHRFVVAFTF